MWQNIITTSPHKQKMRKNRKSVFYVEILGHWCSFSICLINSLFTFHPCLIAVLLSTCIQFIRQLTSLLLMRSSRDIPGVSAYLLYYLSLYMHYYSYIIGIFVMGWWGCSLPGLYNDYLQNRGWIVIIFSFKKNWN